MTKGRLEAFSDGVIAIIITIMVLELKVPLGTTFAALASVLPTLACYALSFVFVGIYWNNHHHLLQPVQRVNGPILWANLHLLFWLSLVPFATEWMGENKFAASPVALYGIVLLGASLAFLLLTRALVALQGEASLLRLAIGHDWKGKSSLLLYAAAVPLAFVFPDGALAIYVLVAILWFLPDRRIEHVLEK